MSDPTRNTALDPRVRQRRFLEAMRASAAFAPGHRPVAAAAPPSRPQQPRRSPDVATVAARTFGMWTARILPTPDRS